MADLIKFFRAFKESLANFSCGLLAALFLTVPSPEGFAENQLSGQTASETYVQQIGPAEERPRPRIHNAYNLVPPHKPLRGSTRFKVVDSFNRGGFINSLGGLWTVEEGEEKKVRLELKREDSRHARSGGSLWARVNIKKKDKAAFHTSLEKLDMSAAHYLLLQCKTLVEPPFHGRIRVGLTDWAGKTVEKDVTEACAEKEGWNEVVIPMAVFMGVDLDQLSFLSVHVFARDKNLAGIIGLDEIAFLGGEEVGFESVRDNFVGFPKAVLDEPRRRELVSLDDDEELLLKIAEDTWRYFENAIDKRNSLIADHFKVGDFPLAGTYTSPTNIGLDLMGTVAARELGILSPDRAEARVRQILRTLQKLETWRGFFFNFYETTRLNVTRRFISSVDSGWLATALVVVRQAFPGKIAEEASDILERFHFQELFDPDTNQLRVGYDVENNRPTPYHYGMLMTEARIASLYGIGKGDLSPEHWWFLYRTAPDAWTWQTQKPQGKMVERGKISYFQGYYTEESKKFVPSWGGSLFEFLMPTLVIREREIASKSFGANARTVVQLHKDYALKKRKYPVWGISPASTSDGRRWMYEEYGIKALGVKGYRDRGVITPHVSFLALDTSPKEALENIRRLLTFPLYGEYGFYDSITFPRERVNPQYLTLDQGMVLIPIANYLKKGVIQKYFHQDPVGEKIESLLEQEDFFHC